MFALDKDGMPFCAEKAADFILTPDISCRTQNTAANAEITVSAVNFRITGDNTVDLKIDIRMRCTAYENSSCRAVTSAEAPENRLREKDGTAALTLYYADAGENLWNIAQLYCTSVDALKLENQMTDDVIQARGMILIPM